MEQKTQDAIWTALRAAAQEAAEREPILASHLHTTVLNHKSLHDALAFLLAQKLCSASLDAIVIREVIDTALAEEPAIGDAVRADLQAVRDRDPAARGYLEPFLHFKGFHSLESYRVTHWLWENGRSMLACHLQNRISEIFGVDIHPAARIGKGILIDHATSVVVGETAVIEDNVSMLHEVTLGGTGKQTGDRHPKIRRGVLIGAGAKILGNVEVGEGSKIGAGSVVLTDVPAHSTAAGVPAKLVGKPEVEQPALEMDHQLPRPDESEQPH